MKSITVFFDDADFAALVQAKKDKTWREFLLQLRETPVNPGTIDA